MASAGFTAPATERGFCKCRHGPGAWDFSNVARGAPPRHHPHGGFGPPVSTLAYARQVTSVVHAQSSHGGAFPTATAQESPPPQGGVQGVSHTKTSTRRLVTRTNRNGDIGELV